jgi:hypothetical protein
MNERRAGTIERIENESQFGTYMDQRRNDGVQETEEG